VALGVGDPPLAVVVQGELGVEVDRVERNACSGHGVIVHPRPCRGRGGVRRSETPNGAVCTDLPTAGGRLTRLSFRAVTQLIGVGLVRRGRN
ncbi:hypothetical protein KDA06_05310, partial [Candidatus Saccharibacteria bacterium]|nr:hypothetical protein [Candidatus Saccharibacteria bacterium]